MVFLIILLLLAGLIAGIVRFLKTPAQPVGRLLHALVPLSMSAAAVVLLMRMAQGSTAGTYKVTVTAGTATQGTNRLQQLRFGAGSNAVIDTGTQAASGGNFSINVPATPSEYTFTLKRAASGQAVTVPVTVVDSCGEWQTLIGSGTGAP